MTKFEGAKDEEKDAKDDNDDANLLTLLPMSDIIFDQLILPRLLLSDLMNLRSASQQLKVLIDEYFQFKIKIIKYFDLASLEDANNVRDANISRDAKLTDAKKTLIIPKNDSVSFGRVTLSTIVSKRCLNLQELHLCNCKFLNDPLIINIFTNCYQLRVLDISASLGITNEGLIKGLTSRRDHLLQVLSLKQCHWISKRTIEVIASNCLKLQKIDLTSCWLITDEEIIKLLINCKRLNHLIATNCYSLSDNTLINIGNELVSSFGGKKKRIHFNFTNCWRLTNFGVLNLASKILKKTLNEDERDANQNSLLISGQGSPSFAIICRDMNIIASSDWRRTTKDMIGVSINITNCNLISPTLIQQKILNRGMNKNDVHDDDQDNNNC